MAELKITETEFGDVTVLRLDGKITIGEGSVALRQAVRRLLDAGRRKFVLNLGGVSYIDSSGGGELVSTYTSVQMRGGRLNLCYLTEKVHDLFTLNKMATVYDIFSSVEEAVRQLSEPGGYAFCPVFECRNRLEFSILGRSVWNTCSRCGTILELVRSPGVASDEGRFPADVAYLRFPTYEREYVTAKPGKEWNVTIWPRLDLFVAEVVRKAWLTVPAPRRAILNLNNVRAVTPAGLDLLLDICEQPEGGRAVIIWEGGGAKESGTRPGWRHVYASRDEALAALGDAPGAKSLTLTLYPNEPA